MLDNACVNFVSLRAEFVSLLINVPFLNTSEFRKIQNI
ncbi:MAG: hypothetical protein ACJAZY_002793 [Spirosomataceae bacterium]|jgi:hypothetical protein